MKKEIEATGSPVPPPAQGVDIAAWILIGAGLLFVFCFRMVSALVAGLLVSLLLHKFARLLRGRRFSHGAAKAIAVAIVMLLAAGIVTAFVFAIVGMVRGRLGDLPALFGAMAEALEKAREKLGKWGMANLIPDRDAEQLQKAVSSWLREHGAGLQAAGGKVFRFAAHAFIGIVIALLVFLGHETSPVADDRPFAASMIERVRRFAAAFESVMLAQIEISLVNTVLTALYLFAALPLAGHRLPLSGTLVGVTFLAGLIPVAGNLISNTIIVILSLAVSPWLGVVSLVFLILVHKLEYVLNAKIVGHRIGAAAWETLLAIVVFEVAFHIPGVILAPVIYAYVKTELRDRRLV